MKMELAELLVHLCARNGIHQSALIETHGGMLLRHKLLSVETSPEHVMQR